MEKSYVHNQLDETYHTYLKYALFAVIIYCASQFVRMSSADNELIAQVIISNCILNTFASVALLALLRFGPHRLKLGHAYGFFIAGLLTATSLRTAIAADDPSMFLAALVVLLGAACTMFQVRWFALTYIAIGATFIYTRLFISQEDVGYAQNSIILATFALSLALFVSRRYLQIQALTAKWNAMRSEEALKEELTRRIATEQELMSARERLQVVMDQAPIGMFWKNENLEYMGCNQNFAEVHGFSSEQDIQGKVDEQIYDDQNLVGSFRDIESTIIESDEPLLNRVEHFCRVDGIWSNLGTGTPTGPDSLYYECSRVPLHDADGCVIGILGTVENVTEKIVTNEQEAQMVQRLLNAQKFESLGSLSGGIAHEFNNILVGVMGNADYLKTKLDEDSKLHKQIDGVIESAQRASHLVQQMLLYSGQREIQKDWLDLNQMVEDMQNMIGAMISKKVRVEFERASIPLDTIADAGQLRQVLVNLVMNASEAMKENEGVITIRTGSTDSTKTATDGTHQSIYVEVSDNGEGMDEETLQRIFDPFFSTKFLGRGLGMAAVQGIVHAHDGSIEVKSSPGAGTTIRVSLPGTNSPSERETAPELLPIALRAEWGGKVLLIDDEEMVLDVTSSMLTRMGFEVTSAVDGEEGLQRFNENGNDWAFLIVDRTMPKLSGEQIIATIREQSADVPIIVCSGFSDVDLDDSILNDTMIKTLNKPFQQRDLNECLRSLLKT